MGYKDVIAFWYTEIEPKQRWIKDAAFDALIRERFGKTHQQAIAGELSGWRDEPLGRLAEVIVLDQFSRNMFRDEPQSFLYDSIGLVLVQEAIRVQADQAIPEDKRNFLYMPYMHSESLKIHEEGRRYFEGPGNEGNLSFMDKHTAIIRKYGRYPHRNEILGRKSTEDEISFLQGPGSSF